MNNYKREKRYVHSFFGHLSSSMFSDSETGIFSYTVIVSFQCDYLTEKAKSFIFLNVTKFLNVAVLMDGHNRASYVEVFS